MNEYVNRQTGELIDFEQQLNDAYNAGKNAGERKAGEVLQRHSERNKKYAQIAAAREDKRYFLQLNEGNGRQMLKDLSLADAGVLYILVTNIYFDSEGLLAKEGKDGKPKALKKADLMKLLGKSKNGVDAAAERLEQIGAIRIDRSKRTHRFFINEELVKYGKRTDNSEFTKVYKTRARQLFKKLSDREAGAVFMCMPYVHYSTQALVYNAHERDLTKVKPIRGNDLAEILGLKYDSLTNLTSKLKQKGALMIIDVGTQGKGYVLNPYLADRGHRTDFTERARAYFSVFEDKQETNVKLIDHYTRNVRVDVPNSEEKARSLSLSY
jgi:hypothetical protein